MKALVLNGDGEHEDSLGSVEELLAHELNLRGWQIDTLVLREKEIARCTGCFGCWVKSPGICVIDDFGRDLARLVVRSDLLVFLSLITFGCYSSELKKAVDRFACPMLLPFFTKVEGEIHHRARYTPLPNLLGIGILPMPDEPSERIFKDLVERNALNFHSQKVHSAVFYTSQDPERIEKGVQALLEEIGI